MDNARNVIFIGAGGHAKIACDIATMRGYILAGYVDPVASSAFPAPQMTEEEGDAMLNQGAVFFIGIGGQKTDTLKHRLSIFDRTSKRAVSPSLVHPAATVSAQAQIAEGALIGAGAIVQIGARIGACSIVNTGAIIEHDCVIGRGVHIAPGAIILGDVTIGDYSMIGAGAVVLPGARLPEGSFVKALTRE